MWEDVHEAVDEILITEFIDKHLAKLSPREEIAVRLRYFLKYTYKQIGETLKVGPDRASQIEHRGIRKLRKFENEFRKLNINWIDKFYERLAKEQLQYKIEREEKQKKWIEECKKRDEEAIQRQIAKRKLKIVEGKGQTVNHPELCSGPKKSEYEPPFFPPFFVKLSKNNEGKHFLYVLPGYGSIDRNLDPETYDKWLEYLISQEIKPISNKF